MTPEISTDADGTVYVRWHGGPYTVLDPDGTVSAELGMGGRQQWAPLPELPEVDDRGDYDDGYADGVQDAAVAAADAAPVRPRKTTAATR